MEKSVAWVGWLKAFGIMAVILGHISNPFNDFIYSWHMPLFFMLSGFFIKANLDIRIALVKDWGRLMKPYFIFAAIAIVVESIKRWGLNRESLNYIQELVAVLYWMDMEHLINSYAFVLWFLPALFFARGIFYIVSRLSANRVLQIGIYTVVHVLSFQVELPFALSNAMNSVLWIYLGSLMFEFFGSQLKKPSRMFSVTAAFSISLVFVTFIYLYLGIPELNMSLLNYGTLVNGVAVFVWAISIVCMLGTVLFVMQNQGVTSTLAELWGSNTMILFVMHPYTNNIAHIIVEKIEFGGWSLKLLISLILLQGVLTVKSRFYKGWFFKNV